jgi:tRNA-specific 2-thiouridylase
MKKKIVFLGISGGVDSAVSAALLQEQGYDVVGVFIRTWHPDFIECNEEEERRDAMRVAAHLDIPFLTFDLQDVYKKEVADYMISEYKAGRTPNPDVMCNKEVKFGAFLKKALSVGADYVATGHYAMNKRGPEKKYFLCNLSKGKDSSKDQSYFLWTLKQEQLKKILFPIGNLQKTEVRKLAKKLKLPVAEKKDSQGICFLGDIDLKDFLKHYIKEKRGKVMNEKGEEVGHHDGVVFHTLGERHGFTITKKSPNDGAYYVVGKDLEKNILVVSHTRVKNFLKTAPSETGGQGTHTFFKNPLHGYSLVVRDTNWIGEIPEKNKNPASPAGRYIAQIRYHGEFLPCNVIVKNKNTAEVTFSKPVLVDAGQSCVIYDKNVCLGGGVIV